MSSTEYKSWIAAMVEEYNSLERNSTWEKCEEQPTKRAIGSKWIFKSKQNSEGQIVRYKARVVAQGFSQKQFEDYEDTYAPVPHYETIRTVLLLATHLGMTIKHIDVDTAFLYATLNEELYLQTPMGFKNQLGTVVRLRKTLYGLKQSPERWNKHITSTVTSMGFNCSVVDQCLFLKFLNEQIQNILLIFVDDIINCGKNAKLVQTIFEKLQKVYKVKDLGNLKHFLNVNFSVHEKSHYTIQQQVYIEQLAEKLNVIASPSPLLPAVPGDNLADDCGDKILCENTKYRSAIGALLYLQKVSRPDVCWPVNQLSRVQENAKETHWTRVERVAKFLNGTKNDFLKIDCTDCTSITVFTDASFGCDNSTGKSTTGYAVFIGNGLISWGTKKQKTVSLSTTEAELVALCKGIQEGLYLQHLLQDFSIFVKIQVYCDNKSTIYLAEKNQVNSNTKHIATKRFFVKDLVDQKAIELHHISGSDMVADLFTKQVVKEKFQKFKKVLGFVGN